MHYVYVLKRKKNNEWQNYIGYSADLDARIEKHRSQYPCKLKYYEAFSSESAARKREQKLKHYGSAWRALKERI